MYEVVLPQPGMPEIEVNTRSGWVDLHNFAEFQSLRYETTGHLVLRWEVAGDQFSKLDGQLVTSVELHFTGVSRFQVGPRDPDVPQSEDAALEHFQLIDQEAGQVRMLFEFIGGASIDVTASDVKLAAEKVRG